VFCLFVFVFLCFVCLYFVCLCFFCLCFVCFVWFFGVIFINYKLMRSWERIDAATLDSGGLPLTNQRGSLA